MITKIAVMTGCALLDQYPLKKILLLISLCISAPTVVLSMEPWESAVRGLSRSQPEPENLNQLIEAAQQMEARTRELSVAIFSAGHFHLGNVSEGERGVRFLRVQESEFARFLAPERLYQRCDRCQGSGVAQVACRSCRASGACTTCSGRGQRATPAVGGGTRIVHCTACGSSGRCANCQGTGYLQHACRTCNGRRQELHRPAALRAYQELLEIAIRELQPLQSIPETAGIPDDFPPEEASAPDRSAVSATPGNPQPSPVEIPGVDQAIRAVVRQLLSDLDMLEIERVAVSRLYFNGSSTHAFASWIRRRLTGVVLQQKRDAMVVMDRFDLQLNARENQLQWLFQQQEGEAGFDSSEVILLGEILWQPPFLQGLISLRALDSQTGKILSAPAQVFALDGRLAERLNFDLALPQNVNLLAPKVSFEESLRALRGHLKEHGGTFALADQMSIPDKHHFAYRVTYAMITESLVSGGVQVLERELLRLVSTEQQLSGDTLEGILSGTGILALEFEEFSPQEAPEFHLRAVNRTDGRLIAQVDVQLSSPGLQTSAGFGAGESVRMQSIGSGDGLAEAIQHFQDSARIPSSDPMRLRASLRLGRSMQIPDVFLEQMSVMWWANRVDLFHNRISGGRVEAYEIRNSQPLDGLTKMDAFLEQVIPFENGNLEAVRANVVYATMVGLYDRDRNRISYYPGPLQKLAHELAGKYTINRDRSPSPQWWNQLLLSDHGRDLSFASALWRSIHPQHQRELRSRSQTVLNPSNGLFEHRLGSFRYRIELEWSGRYLQMMRVELDLSPMRTQLHRVEAGP